MRNFYRLILHSGGSDFGATILTAFQEVVTALGEGNVTIQLYNVGWGRIEGDQYCTEGYACPDLLIMGTTGNYCFRPESLKFNF